MAESNVETMLTEETIDQGGKLIEKQTLDGANNKEQTKKKKKRKSNTRIRQERLANVDGRQGNRDIVMDNENLTKYYKAQSFLNEGEFDEFLEGLRTTLPASFRINAIDYDQAKYLRRLVKNPEFCEFLKKPSQDKVDKDVNLNATKLDQDKDEAINGTSENTTKIIAKSTTQLNNNPPTIEPLCWYPNELGWQMNVTRIDLKKSPLLQQLHRFIMAETENGFISRQEAVSMIPPLLLDIKLGQTVMDMCAAPGSKTAQLLEYLNFDVFDAKPHFKDIHSKDLFNDGLVVANDVDNKRCYMLVHQANRLNSPNCVIINEDASRIPDMKIFNSENKLVNLKFDRILCDVPCSGDGTVRKNPDLWRKWSVGNANNFHGLQSKILRRGLELLKKDGLLVYSTCSMNPAENESVIASILRAAGDSVVLEDISQKLTGLRYRPGVSKWTVMGRDMEPIDSAAQIKPDQASQIFPTLFPPTEDESRRFNLHRCIRLLPHLQNTGAFFVAVLRKRSLSFPWQQEKSATTSTTGLGNGLESNDTEPKRLPVPQPKRRKFGGFKEDPFIFMNPEDPDWLAIKEAYGLDDRFPCDQLMYRCKRDSTKPSSKRTICLVSKRTREFIIANQEEPDKKEFVKLINGGMRLFARAESESGFRICQDGVAEIQPYIKDCLKVLITRDDLVALLKQRNVTIEDLSGATQIRDKVSAGSFIMIYKHVDEYDSFEMALAAWKGERSVALYVAKTFRIHLCALVQLKVIDAVDL